MFLKRESRMESVRPDQPRIATCASTSLRPCVSVGMQRVSSLRTRCVAGSNTGCKAHKKGARLTAQGEPLRPIRVPKEGGGIYDCAHVPLGEAGQGASPANRGARGGRAERRGDAQRGDNAM